MRSSMCSIDSSHQSNVTAHAVVVCLLYGCSICWCHLGATNLHSAPTLAGIVAGTTFNPNFTLLKLLHTLHRTARRLTCTLGSSWNGNLSNAFPRWLLMLCAMAGIAAGTTCHLQIHPDHTAAVLVLQSISPAPSTA
jgi:hypothetical protein